MIDSNREQFEKLPEIAVHLKHGNVFFDEEKQTYASEFSALHFVACYVNGAWHTYQEQQKKLDCCREENKVLLSKLNIPDGYKLVPCEPTKEMLIAADNCVIDGKVTSHNIYKAMIGAAT